MLVSEQHKLMNLKLNNKNRILKVLYKLHKQEAHCHYDVFVYSYRTPSQRIEHFLIQLFEKKK